MIKATAGRKVYYIYPKKEISKNDALADVAIITHEKPSNLEVFDAKLIGADEYVIGTKGNFYAITRR